MQFHLSPERQAQLDQYAQQHGQDPATALDDLLAIAFDTGLGDEQAAVEGIRRGYHQVRAGRTRKATEFLSELRAKHGF